ncbi:MAG: glycosyltransferase [Holosporaceae bacterium]|nr:glycosyltransferase [Holosporaceae bacterium]
MKLFRLIFIFFIFEVGAKPKISIIIPVYNTERFLRECLDSILNQTFTDFEVICINDASSDRCSDILREYANKDKRVRVINHEKNAGMAAARNTGLDAAEGEYIGFSDSDDYMHPDMIKIMYTEIRRNDCDLAICQIWMPKEHERPIFKENISYSIDIPRDLFVRSFCKLADRAFGEFLPVWNKLYKKSAIASIRFDPKLFGADDSYFNLCAASFVKKYVKVSAELYGWRQHPASSRFKLRKMINGYSGWIESIYNSSNDFIPSFCHYPASFIYCDAAASAAAKTVMVDHDNLIYLSEQIYNTYSKGFIDTSCCKGFLRKILVASFIAIGKIRSWFKVS